MGKYIKLTLICLLCVIISLLLSVLARIIPTFFIAMNISDMELRELPMKLADMLVMCAFLYITMRKNGYQWNKTYEKNSLKELLIPIMISSVFAGIIIGLYSESGTVNLFWFFVRLVPFILCMVFGYIMGYKKRERERKELTSKK